MTAFWWCLLVVCVVSATCGVGFVFFERKRTWAEVASWTGGGLALLVLGVGGGIAILATQVASRSPPVVEFDSDRPQPKQLVWERHAPPNKWCSAEFPSKPNLYHSVTGVEENVTVTTLWAISNTLVVGLISGDIPPERMFLLETGATAISAWMRRNAGGETAKQVKSERDIEASGLQWRELELRDRTRMRFATFDGRFYVMVVTTLFSDEQEANAQRFFDSFRLETPKP